MSERRRTAFSRLLLLLALSGVVLLTACKGSKGPSNPQLGSSSQPQGPPGNWALEFQEEFSGNRVDESKWNLAWPFSPPLNNGLQTYVRKNATVSNGLLHLIATHESAGGQPYSSGGLTTQNKYSFTYGAVEARLKAPAGKGFWPAFWMLYPNGPWPPEIDIVEMLGNIPRFAFLTFHYGSAANPQSSKIPAASGVDFSADFHVFTVDWQPGAISWYVDGKLQGSHLDAVNVPTRPMVLLLNLGVGGAAGGFSPGTPDGSTPFPSELTVDYVRVWRRQ